MRARGWRGFHHHTELSIAAYGHTITLVRDGKMDEDAMRQALVSRKDLEEAPCASGPTGSHWTRSITQCLSVTSS